MKFAVCETVAAITLHARVVGDEGMVYGGGLHSIHGARALCGAKVSWDTRIRPEPSLVTCGACHQALLREVTDP